GTDSEAGLDTGVKRAGGLCGADDGALFQREDANLRLAASHGPMPAPSGFLVPIAPGTVGGRTVLERRAIHVADLQVATDEYPEGSAIARELGHRTILSAPLLRDGAAVGVLHVRRTEVNPFTVRQIALLETFADQAGN